MCAPASSIPVVPALAVTAGSIGEQVRKHGSLAAVPAEAVANVRNDMYLASEGHQATSTRAAPRAFDADTKMRVKPSATSWTAPRASSRCG
jgi:PiT family inorganic phosphate transporter